MKRGSCYQTTSSCSCRCWKLGNNKFIWKLGWATVSLYQASLQREGWKTVADKESDDHKGTLQIATNTDTAACLGYSLGLTNLLCWDHLACTAHEQSGRRRERLYFLADRQRWRYFVITHSNNRDRWKDYKKNPQFLLSVLNEEALLPYPWSLLFPSFVHYTLSQNSVV